MYGSFCVERHGERLGLAVAAFHWKLELSVWSRREWYVQLHRADRSRYLINWGPGVLPF